MRSFSSMAAPLEGTLPNIEWLESLDLDYCDESPVPDLVCFNCGASSSKLLRCAQCQVAAYCQKECQVADWKAGGHKKACDSFRRVGLQMKLSEDDKMQARNEVFGRVRIYACAYAVHHARTVGRGFLFLQSAYSLAAMSLAKPKDCYGRELPNRSLLLHFLTMGEYDSEVCREDFEIATVRSTLQDAVETYDQETHVVILMRFRCGNMSVGVASLVPNYNACLTLGVDYFGESTAGSLELRIDDQ